MERGAFLVSYGMCETLGRNSWELGEMGCRVIREVGLKRQNDGNMFSFVLLTTRPCYYRSDNVVERLSLGDLITVLCRAPRRSEAHGRAPQNTKRKD